MGIAVLSGVIESLDTHRPSPPSKWESHTPGTLTPTGPPDASIPTNFVACVSREESATKLRALFAALGPLGAAVEVLASRNLDAVRKADVVLLW